MASSALFAGVSGLQAHQGMLDVVGNNLANVNTVGYKSESAQFGDLLYQTLAPATAGTSANVGGTNPIQEGFGVRVAGISQNLSQGSFQDTGNSLDLALQGSGFFVVNDGTRDLFTRAGSFGVDGTNFLVDPTTGYHVQRFGTVGEGSATSPAFQTSGDNSIKIPYGTGIPGKETGTITLQGNLNANAVGPQAQSLTSVLPFLAGGAPATLSTLLNSLDDSNHNYVGGDQILIHGTTVGGTAVNTSLTLSGGPPPTTTMGDLINAINAAFPGSTASLDSLGNLVLTANNTGPNTSLSLSLSDASTNTGSTTWNNHSLSVTTVGKNGDTFTTAIQIFDTQGNAHTLTLTFQKEAANTWNMTGSINPAEGTMTKSLVAGITFNDSGAFEGVTGTGAGAPSMTVQINGLSQPQTLNFSFGSVNGFNGLTQFGSDNSAAATSQDGYAAGFLNSLSIDKDGIINGVFTNGRILPVAQLAIASFTNPNGLERQGDNYYALSTNSGVPLIGGGQSGGRGFVQQGVLESSNVDVSLEFTRLIIAQRGFQVNARTITAANEILQDLVNIIH
jgi:flagellar hook protein FlgE